MMDIKVDGQIFSLEPSTIKTMVKMIDATHKDGKERGFNMCEPDTGGILAGSQCEGNECDVLLRGCFDKKAGKYIGQQVGSFHTHAKDLPANFGDLLSAVNQAIEWRGRDFRTHKRTPGAPYRFIECIGIPGKGVRCKAVKDIPADFILGKQSEYITGLTSPSDEALLESYFTGEAFIAKEELKRGE